MRRHVAAIAIGLIARLCVAARAQSTPGTSSSKTSSVCKDGSMSSVVGRGACSGHGGVDSVATAAAKKSRKAAKADAKADKAIASKNPQKAAARGGVGEERRREGEQGRRESGARFRRRHGAVQGRHVLARGVG